MLITTSNANTELTIKNYDVGFNKTYYGNITLKCKNENACNMTTLYCDTGNCYIEASGHNKGQLNNLIVDARNIRKGYKFELKCGSQSQNSVDNTNCNNVKVLCPLHRGATCKCSNCNYRQVKFYCEMGIGVYCTGARVISTWNQNNIWCDGGPFNPYGGYGGYGGGSGKYICDDVDWEMSSCESTYTNPTISFSLYNFAPNDKCVAFQSSYYNTYYKEDITMITTHSCRETINATTREYKYHLPICVKYISKPDDIPELKQYFNITRIIIKNKTNIINQTNWIDQIRIRIINETNIVNKTRWIDKDKIRWVDKERITWINKTRWFNRTRWLNKTRWFNKTRWLNKTNVINKTQWTKKSNGSSIIIKKESEHTNDKKGNETGFQIDFNNILVLGGISLGGLLICSCTFYVGWECWLKEHIEEMIINCLCCGYGEQFMTIMEWWGFFEDWEKRKEKREDSVEFYGLTPEQIAVCKQAKSINILKYKEAQQIVWEEQCKYATRPDDPYHRLLLGKVKSKRDIEMIDIPEKNDEPEKTEKPEEQYENTVIKILPGTPRRRRRVMVI
uniref:Uncharacterized protein n=1 Tax=viral metagenome TaxID=1070528 RepID=A0A6C0C4R5_9ZZZZ